MKKIRNLIAILAAVMLMTLSVIPAFATEDEVRSTAEGVLFLSQEIDGQPYARGSCFLINEDTVITSNHCVKFTKDEYTALYYLLGMKKEQVDKKLTYTVTIQSDFTIPAKLVNSSENMDFAILKLSQPISNHTFLKLRDSKTVKAAEKVYSVGFPAVKDTTKYYNQKDIVFESGTINRTQYTTEEDWFAYSPFFTYENGDPVEVPYHFKGDMFLLSGNTISGGNSGGPLIDENGNVIGICMAGSDENCYASSISQVMEVLDTIGVPYTSNTGSNDVTTTQNSTTTTTTIPASSNPAGKTDSGNESSSKNNNALIIGIIAAVAVLAIIIVIALVLSKKKGAAPAPAPSPSPVGGFTPPAPPAAPVSNTMTGGGADGTEGTTVLSGGMAGDPNATTVLGASASSAYLVRTSNNEKINITKPYFKIGKDANRVDYCVSGNPAVSRFHASIVSKNGQYFIVDNSTTNHTYVNDSMIPANVETQITNGAKIRLADEKFEFKI